MSLIKEIDLMRTQGRLVGATETRWIYNYFLRQRHSFLGIKFWKTIHSDTFSFPRLTNSPKRDGLAAEVRQHIVNTKYAYIQLTNIPRSTITCSPR